MSDSDVKMVRSAAEEYMLCAGAVEEGHRYFYSKAMAEDILSLTDRLVSAEQENEKLRAERRAALEDMTAARNRLADKNERLRAWAALVVGEHPPDLFLLHVGRDGSLGQRLVVG